MKASVVLCVLVGLLGCSSNETGTKEAEEVVVEEENVPNSKTENDRKESGVQVEIIEESKECTR